jgi:hypothetical protein
MVVDISVPFARKENISSLNNKLPLGSTVFQCLMMLETLFFGRKRWKRWEMRFRKESLQMANASDHHSFLFQPTKPI